jgi:hypothetical protein
MSTQSTVLAVYATHTEVREAVKKLQSRGVDVHKVSIIGRAYHTDEHVVGYYSAGGRMRYWGKIGAFWEGFWELLFGSGFFWIPGLGPVLAAGPVVEWIVKALENELVMEGFSVLGADLCRRGIAKDSVLECKTALRTGQLLLIVHGTAGEVAKAKDIL